jgi:DNA polymerase (family 10)
MKNNEVAELLEEIADLLELKEVPFKPAAYRKAAMIIESLSEDIEEIWKKGKLEEIPSVGKGISKKISDFLEDGKSSYLEKLKKQTPVDIEELGKIEGLGPKTIAKLYKKLHVRNLRDLEKAAKEGEIRKIFGLGPTVEENILKSIEFSKMSSERHLLGFVLPIVNELMGELGQLKEIKRIEVAGSTRRRKETIRDIDILITSNESEKVMDFFVSMGNVDDVLAKGPTKSSVRLREGIQADVRIINEKSYGAALLYFTGSKEHNIALRRIAMSKNMKLSEYGLFSKKTNKMLAGKTEEEVYRKLGMPYIEPELREDNGEIETALKRRLPKLLKYDEVRGDLQMHTEWSDGNNTIEEMALAAKKIGHEYICITDHTGALRIANALDEKRVLRQSKEIDMLNKKIDGITILKGVEVNIKDDGSLDMSNRILKELDIVVASIHSGFKNSKEKLTKRLVRAMENENIDIIAHPTGRLIQKRPPYEIDFEKVFDTARETKTILEINSFPQRMDLKDVHARAAIKAGVKLAINTDAHNTDQLRFIELGIATARRGWAEKKDIVNALPLKRFLRLVK